MTACVEAQRSSDLQTPLVDDTVSDLLTGTFETVFDPDNSTDCVQQYLRTLQHGSPIGRMRRSVSSAQLLACPGFVHFLKALFNWYFTADLREAYRQQDEYFMLSSGSLNEKEFALPDSLKRCITVALANDWYGYSSSLGRDATRAALADLENVLMGKVVYDKENVAVTLGGTSAIASLADFLALRERRSGGVAICATPNYPPLLAAIAYRMPIRLVPLRTGGGYTDLSPLFALVKSAPSMILVQTVTNPSGLRVREDELERLITSTSPATTVILDECHECWADNQTQISAARARSNVIRVKSLSKMMAAPGLKAGWIVGSRALLKGFYEHASTTYGSPASIFYLLLEFMARLEAWRIAGKLELGEEEVSRFEKGYELSVDTLNAAYQNYVTTRASYQAEISKKLKLTTHVLRAAGWSVISPSHSINVVARAQGSDEPDYKTFRRFLKDKKISLYPGVLAATLSGNWVRLTPMLSDDRLSAALAKMTRG